MGGRGRFVVAGLLIVAAVVYLVVSNTGSTARFYTTVEELRAIGEEGIGRPVTVSGAVLGDTIAYDSLTPRVTFTIVHVPGDRGEVERAGGLAAVLRAAIRDPDAARLEIVYGDVRPDLLQDGVQAIVRGELGEDGRFYADEVLLKCPARYEEEIPEQAEEP